MSTSSALDRELDDLDLTTQQRREVARHPPELVRQWLSVATGKEIRSGAAVLISGLRSGKPPSPPAEYSLARSYVVQYGWPTGSRWVRGNHAGTYVPDPLGRDSPPHSVPWARPALADIQAALEGQAGGDEP